MERRERVLGINRGGRGGKRGGEWLLRRGRRECGALRRMWGPETVRDVDGASAQSESLDNSRVVGDALTNLPE